MAEQVDVDYLVVGAGAMGIAFVDTILSDSNKTVAWVDKYSRPGGHWTLAYPYVRLHQPSAFYGVNSKPLGENRIDQVGWNKGMFEMAARDEVLAYYSTLMQHIFLPSGRIKYFPQHEYIDEGEFHSTVTGKKYRVGQTTRIVDATYMKVKVPAMGPPAFEVDQDVKLIPPNDLPNLSRPFANYTVLGSGKTGLDACLWLISNGVDPSNISWVMPRDTFYAQRDKMQKFSDESTMKNFKDLNEAIMGAKSVDDMLDRMVEINSLMRLSDDIRPLMFHCATVSSAEMPELKKIQNVIRKGRVVKLTPEEMVLEQGKVSTNPDTLYVNCTANSIPRLAPVPVFRGRTITLQPVRYCQQVFSAAFIGHVETAYESDPEDFKNALCNPIPHPDKPNDYPLIMLQTHLNDIRWRQQPRTAAWLKDSRLDWTRYLAPSPPEDPAAAAEFSKQMTEGTHAMVAKLKELLAGLPEEEEAAKISARL